MKRILGISSVLIVITIHTVFSQNCPQTLRLANETYQQGRLHELPNLLKNCLANGFTKEEKRDAYKLLTQAYIYLEEPEKADEAMLNLLKTEPFFEINEKVDPAEFIALYKKFRSREVISFVGKFGFTQTFVNTSVLYSTGNSTTNLGKFSPNGISIYYGIGVEKRISNRFTLAPEILMMSKTFVYDNPQVFDWGSGSGRSAASVKSIFNHSRIDLYPLVQYKLFTQKKNSLNPYVALGPGISYLSSAKNDNTLPRKLDDDLGSSGQTVSGKTITSTESFNKLTYSVLALAGVKVKVGPVFLSLDVRFQYGLGNIVKEATRTNLESVFDYTTQFSDIKTHNVMGTFGVVYPLFIPKKLVK